MHTSDREGALLLDLGFFLDLKKEKGGEEKSDLMKFAFNFACIFVLGLYLFGLGRLCST